MKIRIKFTKTGINKYIGHLDLLRYFQKAMRRAGIDMKYTEGFSPHPILSFASPLGLGLTTSGDYFDTELETDATVRTFVKRLNAQMADDISIICVSEMGQDKKSNAMASLAACSYRITLTCGSLPGFDSDKLCVLWREFYALPEIIEEHQTKSSAVKRDIRPLIYKADFDGRVLNVLISSGSSENLRPDAVFTSFLNYIKAEKTAEEMLKDGEIEIERTEMFTTDESGALIPLYKAGKLIEQE